MGAAQSALKSGAKCCAATPLRPGPPKRTKRWPSSSLLMPATVPLSTARPEPGLAVDKGTVAGMSSDELGHLFVLLGGPGRNGVAAQHFAPDLSADWAAPISPYNPLLGPPPATPQTPV